MDIEQLSKSQIVLLTLLVSFFTSMATGIVAVALVDQAPIGVVQTVNRVIEKTVETAVAPVVQTAAAVVPKPTQSAASESDPAAAVARASGSTVRIYTDDTDAASFLGFGTIVAASGMIAADSWALGEQEHVVLLLPDGSRARASVVMRSKPLALVLVQAATTTLDGGSIERWNAVRFGKPPALGSPVLMLSGRSANRVDDGIVAALVPAADVNTGARIDTTVSADAILPGSPLISLDGSLLGISTGVARSAGSASFIPVTEFSAMVAAALK